MGSQLDVQRNRWIFARRILRDRQEGSDGHQGNADNQTHRHGLTKPQCCERIVNGRLSLSIGATRDAGPICKARK